MKTSGKWKYIRTIRRTCTNISDVEISSKDLIHEQMPEKDVGATWCVFFFAYFCIKTTEFIYTYQEECLSVYLSICSLCIRFRYSYRHETFHGPSLGPEEGRGLFFSGNYRAFPPERSPLFPTNGITAFLGIGEVPNKTPWPNRAQVIIGFWGCWARICCTFGWNPVRWLKANRNRYIRKIANLSGIFAETELEEFLKTASSNSMFICLEILLVD